MRLFLVTLEPSLIVLTDKTEPFSSQFDQSRLVETIHMAGVQTRDLLECGFRILKQLLHMALPSQFQLLISPKTTDRDRYNCE